MVSGQLLSQPRWLFNLATRIYPGALYTLDLPPIFANPNRTAKNASPAFPKVIALTIDDGPSPATADILAILERYDAKATFFNISGQVPRHEEILHQTLAAGHEVGNHLTADEPSIRLTPDEFEANLLAAEAIFLPYLNQAPPGSQQSFRWLRPGMGFYNADMVKTAERHGYQLVLGSVFPYDTHIPSSQFASTFILATVQSGDILVLHDGKAQRGQRTATTLEKILPVLQARGYVVTTLTAAQSMGNNK